MWSRIDSPEGRLTRSSATVTICAPEASCACFMTSMDAYLPVPTIRRDENSLPPRTRFVSRISLSPTHRTHDFHPVPFAQERRGVGALRRHLAVHGDRRVLAPHAEVREERLHAHALGDLLLLAVHRDLHKQNGRPPASGAAAHFRRSPCSLRWDYPEQVRGVPGRTRFSGILPPRRQSEYTTAGPRARRRPPRAV